MSRSADPVGFQFDLGFSKAFDIIHATEAQAPPNSPAIFRNIEQAYLTLKPKQGKGVQFDFGKFNTSAGAGVSETHYQLELFPVLVVRVGNALLSFWSSHHSSGRKPL